MAHNDYISVYRQFFEEFAKVSQAEEKGPMRVSVYNLTLDELVGEVMQSCVNYLNERKCPKGLIVPLTKIVVEEFIKEAKKHPDEVNDPLKLNNKTQSKISEVCLRFTDNEKLSNLPAPVQETSYSTHCTKHTRRRMEDRLICLPRFNSLHSIQSNSEAGYYGIFDGHNGVNAANYAASHLHQYLAESEFYPKDPVQAFRQAIEKTEVRYNAKDENSGTTVLAILHQPVEKRLTVAWVGDSQALLVNEDSYVMLVDPHKPERLDERKRIEELGGFIAKVQTVYRVNGGLAVSRAVGDKKLKPYVSAEPEMRNLRLTGSEHFVVMGCDGLWDVVKPEEVIETVYFEIKKNQGQIDTVGRRLVDLAKENNSTDNISVIVIFLTDPTEICNRSVNLSGHRPKILLQDGVIMETNFQTNEKSPKNDPGINGIYERNGTHFEDPMRNESDEDFGPETNVDAIDDVLTSPKALNPFSGENTWQMKTQPADENPEKLIEFSRQEPLTIENEIMMFSEGFTEPAKNLDEKSASELNNDINFDKFPVNNINPFENEMKNMSDPLDFSNSITDESNKYVAEINSKKEEIDNFMNSNFVDETSNIKNEADFLGEFQEKNSNRDAFGYVENCLNDFKENNFNQPEKDSMFNNDEMGDLKLEKVEMAAAESPVQENSVPGSDIESQIRETPSEEMISPGTHDTDATNKIEQFSEFSLKTNEEAADFIPQNEPLDASGHPPALCSVIDVVEAERASRDFQPIDENEIKKEAFTGELLSPSAPAFEGEVKDDIVAESGGEVDSEDDEWNYIKVESGVHQTVPAVNKDSDLVSSLNESSDIEKPSMNSPLNPEADEFIPVSSTIGSNEFNLNTTPIKAIPDHMTDIIASSPDWNNMNNINVPEEAAFLNEIKTRPSNIFENFEPAHQDSLIDQNAALDNSLGFVSPQQTNKENEIGVVPQEEPQGLDLARDMTSSFIDPSTMSSNVETPEGQPDFMDVHKEEAIPETNWSVNEPQFVSEEVSKSTSMPLSEEAFSPKSHTPDTPKSTEVEISKQSEPEMVSPDFMQSEFKPVLESPIMERIPSPTVTEQIDVKPEILSEIVEAPKIPEILEIPESPKVPEIPQSPEPPKATEVPATPQSPEVPITPQSPEIPKVDEIPVTPKSPEVSETPIIPKIPVVPEPVEKSPVAEKPNDRVSEGITETAAAAVAAAAATAVAGAAGIAATKKPIKKDAPKTTPSKTIKPAPATKPLVNGTKTSAPAKKPTASTQSPKPSATAKPTSSLTKTSTSRVSAVNKTTTTTAKPTTTATTNSTLNKVPARPRPTSTTSTVSKTSSPLKTTATTSTTKPTTAAPKTTTRTSTTTVGTAAPKPKPRVPTTSTLNGDAKTLVKRTETTTKKANGTTGSVTTTTTTRVSLTARPATAPAKPTTLKTTTTTTTTRTVSAKPAPRSTATSTTNAASPTSKVSPTARKTTMAPDKQAKEASNRLTSRTSTVTKTNGVLPGKTTTTTTTTKTRKTLTSTTTPSKTKIDNKTETKAEKIVEEKITVIQSENETPLIDTNKDINIINSFNSD